MEVKAAKLHGHTVSYLTAGEGPVLLLVHGLGGSSRHWAAVIEPLAREHTVIAPDLPGHGCSSPGSGDYSVGGFAATLRDLLFVLGHDRASLVGHSLGGGVAMQFSYQFPEITERLVLVSSGGLGPEVSPLFRCATLPGAGPFIAVTAAVVRRIGPPMLRLAATLGLKPSTDVAEVVLGYGALADSQRRAAFLATTRTSLGTRSQRVSAIDRLYLAEVLPVLIVWGARDWLVPAHHGESAHRELAGSRLEVFDEAGHLPQVQAPSRFVAVLERFLAETEPTRFDREDLRSRFRAGSGS